MNITELQMKLEQEKIPSNWYSINGKLASDVFVLRKVYDYWEFFYVDERGNQNNDYKKFSTEDEACKYLYDKVMYEKHH